MKDVLARLAAKPPFSLFDPAEGNRRAAIRAFGHCSSSPYRVAYPAQRYSMDPDARCNQFGLSKPACFTIYFDGSNDDWRSFRLNPHGWLSLSVRSIQRRG